MNRYVDYTSDEISAATYYLEFAVEQERNEEHQEYLRKTLAVMRAVNKVTSKDENKNTAWLSKLSNTEAL